MLNAFVNGTVVKCGDREGMLEAFRNFSRFSKSSVKGHSHAPAGLR